VVVDITEHPTAEGKLYCPQQSRPIYLVGVRERLTDAEIVPSVGSVGDCYDNSLVESFWGTMQLELLDSRAWKTRAELANAIFEWIDTGTIRPGDNSSIGMLSPIAYEATPPAQDH
jgi:putative transposase